MAENRKLTKEQCTEARRLRDVEGLSFAQIGKALHVAALTAARAYVVAGGDLPDCATYNAMKQKMSAPNGPPRTVAAYVNAEGYRRVVIDENDPFFSMGSIRGDRKHDRSRTVLEHRLVLARKLGRPLLDHETVHHKDGDRLNNNPDNLELRVGRHGKGSTEAHCQTCACFVYN